MIAPHLLTILREYHADENPHLAGSLVDHLIGVHDLLERWGDPPYLCLAGLFHSVYGTQLFDIQSVPFAQRERIRRTIGDAAERLAYWFSVTNRGSFFGQLGRTQPYLYDSVYHQIEPVAAETIRDLIELEVANTVEFVPRTPLFAQEIDLYATRFESARHLISAAGLAAVRQVLDEQRALVRAGTVLPFRDPVVR